MSSEDDYDNLSKEEREARDKADREREATEQAGVCFILLHLRRLHMVSTSFTI